MDRCIFHALPGSRFASGTRWWECLQERVPAELGEREPTCNQMLLVLVAMLNVHKQEGDKLKGLRVLLNQRQEVKQPAHRMTKLQPADSSPGRKHHCLCSWCVCSVCLNPAQPQAAASNCSQYLPVSRTHPPSVCL